MTEIINKGNRKLILLILLVGLASISLIQGIRNAARDSQDFQWDAAKVFTMGINPYDESLEPTGILDEYGYDKYYLQMEANQFPSLLMILIPFTLLPPLTARYVWLLLNLLLTILMIWLLKKTFLSDMQQVDFAILCCLMISGTPYRNQLGVGQHTVFAFTFFLLAVYLSEYCEAFAGCDKKSLRGILQIICVSLCLFICFFKYTLTVPLVLYFIYKKRYMQICISGFLHVILTFVSAMWLNDSFINMIIKPLKVSSALSAEGGIDFGALLGGSKLAYVLLIAVMGMLFIIAVKMEPLHDKAFISVLVLWSVIVTYHRTYDFFVVILAVALFYDIPKSLAMNKRVITSLEIMYTVMFITVYFILRVFSESSPSKAVAAVIYYALTVFVTEITIKYYVKPGEKNGEFSRK